MFTWREGNIILAGGTYLFGKDEHTTLVNERHSFWQNNVSLSPSKHVQLLNFKCFANKKIQASKETNPGPQRNTSSLKNECVDFANQKCPGPLAKIITQSVHLTLLHS
jgi:hypothetical protein